MILKDMYLGTSIAISWAWGTSLILGMQIAQQKGLESFLLWASANCITLALFGFLYKKRIIYSEVLKSPIVKVFTALIQLFCLVIQLKILNEAFLNFFSPLVSDALSVGFSLGLFALMYRGGLSASIKTDLYQGALTIIVLLFMVEYAGFNFVPNPITYSSGSDILWGIWSAMILLSGIMTDIQHWQRAEVNGKGYAFEWASIFFAIYLSLVYILSMFSFNGVLNVALLITVIGVTTSTIDSIAVALHKSFGVYRGTLIGVIVSVLFQVLVYQLNVLSLWSYFGIIRVGLALYILYYCYKNRHVFG